MKKVRLFILISLMLGAMGALCACDGGETLSAPIEPTIDENYQLTWEEVENARNYLIEVVNVETNEKQEFTTTKTKISLETFPEGDYDVRVKALGNGAKLKDSDWSKTICLDRAYETGCKYTLINNDAEYQLTKYGTATGDVKIEDTYRGKPVTEIAARAFKGCTVIENLIIGENVRTIGDNAFYNCKSLKSFTLPDEHSLVSIGMAAFQSCVMLEEVEIPETVTIIQDATFSYCNSLAEIELHDKITYIGEYAFSDCTSLLSIDLPDGLTSMGQSAFTGAKALKTVVLSPALTEISASAFYMCSALENIQFADNGVLKTINQNAFGECIALKEVDIPEGVEELKNLTFYMRHESNLGEDGTTTITFKSQLERVTIPQTVKKIGSNVFYGTKFYVDAMANQEPFVYADQWVIGCSAETKEKLEKISVDTLKEGVFGIADYALSGCALLQELQLPSSLQYIGTAAFASCPKLRWLETYADSVKEIGDQAFIDCKILSTVILGEGVERIGTYAFAGCERLDNTDSNVLCPDSVTEIEVSAFKGTRLWTKSDTFGVIYAGNWVVGYDNMKKSSSVELSENVIGIADYAFSKCASLQSVIIPNDNDLQYLGRGAFYACSKLDMLDLSSTNIKEIGEYAFYECSSLSSIQLPRRLKSIGRSAFYNCQQLSKLDLSKRKVETIGDYAFFGCINLKEVNFGDELQTIGQAAFYECAMLEKVSLPATMTKVGNHAFYKCLKLKEVSFGIGLKEIGNYAFYQCSGLRRVDFNTGLEIIGDYAFANCSGLLIVKLNENLRSIGNYAFYGAEQVSALTLPDSLVSVGESAFRNWKNLKTLIVKEELANFGANVFYGCQSLTIYTEAKSILPNWNEDWNSSWQPTVWGCTISEDGSYVLSVTIEDGTLQNAWAAVGFSEPVRAKYTFAGWSTTDGGEVEYSAAEIVNAPVGVTLYAVWKE